MTLPSRLMKIAELVPKGKIIADIGTDHAYLPIYLVQEGICPFAIAGDINKGPYLRAKEQVRFAKLEDKIDVRRGDGLNIVCPGEADIYILAGMGGELITKIIKEGTEKIDFSTILILQPMQDVSFLRCWLVKNAYQMIREELVQERGKLYEIIVAQRGEQTALSPLIAEVGPCLWEGKHPLLPVKINLLLQRYRKISLQLAKSAGDLSLKEEINNKIIELEMMLRCL